MQTPLTVSYFSDVLDEGRQKLFGNVGYRIIEASIHELLADSGDRASWC